jgi:hypothetical protein
MIESILAAQIRCGTTKTERSKVHRGRRHMIPSPIGHGVLARTFCDVEHDQRASTTERIAQVTAPARKRLDDVLESTKNSKRQWIHVETFVAEDRAISAAPVRQLRSA